MGFRRFTFFLFLLLPFAAPAQFVQVSGFVYEKGSEEPVIFANIINLRNRTGVVSNATGFYTILLSAKDTVEVSAIGYKRRKYGLPDNVQPGSYSVNIYLEKDAILVDTVNVRPYDMDRLREEFTNMPLVEEKKMVVGDPSVYSKYTPYRENFGVRLNGPLSWLYNKMSRKSKELDKLRDLQSGYNTELGGSMRLSRDLIKDVTKLQDEEIDAFVQYCRFLNEDLAHTNTYDLRIMIKECFDRYQLDKKSTPPPVQNDSVRN
jgi:hypothetical protein